MNKKIIKGRLLEVINLKECVYRKLDIDSSDSENLDLIDRYRELDKEMCELKDTCHYVDKFQRLPRAQGGLGLCKKLR